MSYGFFFFLFCTTQFFSLLLSLPLILITRKSIFIIQFECGVDSIYIVIIPREFAVKKTGIQKIHALTMSFSSPSTPSITSSLSPSTRKYLINLKLWGGKILTGIEFLFLFDIKLTAINLHAFATSTFFSSLFAFTNDCNEKVTQLSSRTIVKRKTFTFFTCQWFC